MYTLYQNGFRTYALNVVMVERTRKRKASNYGDCFAVNVLNATMTRKSFMNLGMIFKEMRSFWKKD